MSDDTGHTATPPDGLHAGQAGVVLLGRVTLPHISATLADLALRGFVRVEPVPNGDGEDWLLGQLPAPDGRHGDLLPYEAMLLLGLFARGDELLLSEFTSARVSDLNRVRTELVRDAVRCGWMRRWRKGERTPEGERLLGQIRSFRHRLRRLIAADGAVAPDLLPYVLLFGLTSRLDDAGGPDGRQPSVRRLQYAPEDLLIPFDKAWTAHCSEFPGWHQPEPEPRDDSVPGSENPWGGIPGGASGAVGL